MEKQAMLYEKLYEITHVEAQSKPSDEQQQAVPKLKMKTTQEEQMQFAHDKCDTDITVADSQIIMFEIMRHIADNKPRDEQFDELMIRASKSLLQQKKTASAKEAQLTGTKSLAKLYKKRSEETNNSPRRSNRPPNIETIGSKKYHISYQIF